MGNELIRIFSDVHFGDRASRVRQLAQIRPLLDRAEHLVLNGDSLDTRPGPTPQLTAALRAEVLEFFGREVPAATFLTGNHDADISPHHSCDLAGGKVFAVHGDILFETMVPWSRDVPLITTLLAAELAAVPSTARAELACRLAIWRKVAAKIPQRHQTERRALRHLVNFLSDTVWPPWRVLRILRAWQQEPGRAAELLRQHRPRAKFILTGHTHRPGIWHMADGIVVINTGSFCPPFGGYVAEVSPEELRVRRAEWRRREFHPGDLIARFPL